MKIEEKDFKLIELNDNKAIFQECYWMTRKNYDFINFGKIQLTAKNKVLVKDHIVLNVNKETKEITYAYLPKQNL